jgi:tRNA-splicing ligase RtcB (3'-phosphate/5'-hydroxy nucleic acid ligase)
MCVSELKGQEVPIKLWTKYEEVESQALTQLKNIAALPWVFKHVAVMPDCHYGKGATVGSVIAMKDALSPAAVGVDLGCLDKETEYLTITGWKKITEWKGEEILQFDPTTGMAEFTKPLSYIKKDQEYFYHLKHSKGLDQKVCPEHRILFYKKYDRVIRPHTVMAAKDFVSKHKSLSKGLAGGFLTTFKVEDDKKTRNLDLLKVHIMVSADGCLRSDHGCEVHLKKERKVKRAANLLKLAGIEYKFYEHADGTKTYAFNPPLQTKSLNILFSLPSVQLVELVDEIFEWDGHTASDGQRTFSSVVKENADAVQFALAATGIRGGIHRTTYKDKNWNDTFSVYTTKNKFVNMTPDKANPVEKVASEDGKSYCFSVPTGYFVARRSDNIFITGNCGMTAALTNLTASDLPESLHDIRNEIEKAIPTGFNSHQSEAFSKLQAFKHGSGKVLKETLWADFDILTDKVQNLKGRALCQAGTLGGENHFVELCISTDQRVWMMLHSGSRNIGKELAEYHIAIAKTLSHNTYLPDRDLSVFLAKTPEMQAYRRDLFWAQKYAYFNRQVMFELYLQALRKFFPNISTSEYITCHHNYVSEEVHYGEDVIVTRKGAIAANKGQMGIIPGSMGTKSYIVKGKGNPESFNSASHGAGRKLSRGAAKRQFTEEDLAQQTAGVECRKDSSVIDEIPGAYKNIEQVMEYQSDLVEIVAELKQVLCVKG